MRNVSVKYQGNHAKRTLFMQIMLSAQHFSILVQFFIHNDST
jgi:hypothetical protein